MTIRIDKYKNFGSADLNAVFSEMEARYTLIGNTMEIIGGDTLTANQSTIAMSLNGIAYRILHLTAWLRTNEASAAPVQVDLRGEDTSATAYNTNIMTTAPSAVTPATYLSESGMRLYVGDSGADSLGMIDVWINLRSNGFVATATGMVVHSGGVMYGYRYGCSMIHRAFPSVLLTQRVGNEAAQFLSGSYWKLKGIRA